MNDTHCPDGATNAEHDTMIAELGYCPWCMTADEAID